MDNPIDFDTANTVLDQDPDTREPLVLDFFRISQCAALRFLLGLKDGHARQCEALKPAILSQHTSFGQSILGFIGNPFVMHSSGIRGAQEPDSSSRIDE